MLTTLGRYTATPTARVASRNSSSATSFAARLHIAHARSPTAASTPASPATPAAAASAASPATVAASGTPVTPVAAPRLRPAVTSAQLRAQRPRATDKMVVNPDAALTSDSCGPVLPAPEMVNVVNAVTGERMGPRGLEPTRYGDWEAKGRCWDF